VRETAAFALLQPTSVMTIFVHHSADCTRRGDEFYKSSEYLQRIPKIRAMEFAERLFRISAAVMLQILASTMENIIGIGLLIA
jgi:hypothetical protein